MWRRAFSWSLLDRISMLQQRRTAAKRVPPPLPSAGSIPPRVGGGGKLPPPPPLPGAVITAAATSSSALPWKSPQEVLSAFVEFIPTFYVPIHCVAAILSEDCRKHFLGRGRFAAFIKRYRFFFDLHIIEGGRSDVKLRDDLNHPRRGAADEKFIMTDVGDVINYVAKPEFIVSVESIEQGNASVALKPTCAPPAVHVRLEEQVPVLERLKALVPKEFTLLDHVEEDIPEDVLFHPYFDCQGGLASIASKFPEFFQVVDGMIRRRPLHLAPLALNDHTLEESPVPSVAKLVRDQVCGGDIPQWVNITSLYEQLTREQKQKIKREYKSFAGFLRAHGRSVSLSQDMLQVARWIPQHPKAARTSTPLSSLLTVANGEGEARHTTTTTTTTTTNTTDAVATSTSTASGAQNAPVPEGRIQYEYTHTHIINELFDKFPPHRTLNLDELLALVTPRMRPSLPKKVLPWLASYPTYFVVDDSTEKDPQKARIRRASDRQPLDIALELYQYIPDDGIAEAELLSKLSDVHREYVQRIGLHHIVNSLPEWLAFTETCGEAAGDGDEKKDDAACWKRQRLLKRLQTEADLERAIHSEESKQSGSDAKVSLVQLEAAEIEQRWPKLKYEGAMSQQQQWRMKPKQQMEDMTHPPHRRGGDDRG